MQASHLADGAIAGAIGNSRKHDSHVYCAQLQRLQRDFVVGFALFLIRGRSSERASKPVSRNVCTLITSPKPASSSFRLHCSLMNASGPSPSHIHPLELVFDFIPFIPRRTLIPLYYTIARGNTVLHLHLSGLYRRRNFTAAPEVLKHKQLWRRLMSRCQASISSLLQMLSSTEQFFL